MMNSKILAVAGCTLIAGGVACLSYGSYLLGYRKAEKHYYSKLDAEMEAARKYYAKLSKRDDYSSPTKLVDQGDEGPATEFVEGQRFHISEDDFITESAEEFEARVAHARNREEVPERLARRAYVISYEEFNENPKDYDQRTVTYFEKDDVLVEEHDTPVENHLDVLGPDSLDQFGNGSKDPNIVYVRNDYLSMDFEVCRDPDSFEETVLGHLKHGENRKVRKFRLDDD